MIGVVVLILLVGGVLLVGAQQLRFSRRKRTPPELRGDWWSSFERDFWRYAAEVSGRENDRPQHHDRRSDRR
jgi:hypothetical protein